MCPKVNPEQATVIRELVSDLNKRRLNKKKGGIRAQERDEAGNHNKTGEKNCAT